MNISKKKLKRVFKLLVILIIILVLLYQYLINNNKSKPNYINDLRLESNSIYEKVSSLWPLDSTEISSIEKDMASNEGIHLTVIDLNEDIIYSNSKTITESYDKLLLEAMYMDNSYIIANKDYYKLSQPVYYNDKVVAFAIFEKTYKIESDNNLVFRKIVLLVISFLIICIILILGVLLFRKKNYELDVIQEGIQNITNGVLQPISLNKDSDYNGVYNAYNTLIEELSYIMKKQQSYEGKRKAFLTMISHELKTPIATINAYIEGLVSGVAKDEKTQEKYLAIISDKMKQLTIQVEDFFKYAQEDDNKFKYNFEECYADEVIGKIFASIVNSERPHIKIQNMLPKCIFSVDKIRLEQVVVNLYNNALKHTSQNDEIIFRAYREDDDVVIEVGDSGEGINPKDLPYIFDSYYQGQNSITSDYEGVGLGLAICKSIIDKHNGSMKVKSSEGKGTTMFVKIPLV